MQQNEIYKTGERIAALRRAKGMTQSALAERPYVTNRAVSRWEAGYGFPEVTLLPRIAEILGVSVDVLLGAEPEKNSIEAKESDDGIKKTEIVDRPEKKQSAPEILYRYSRIQVSHTVYTIPLIIISIMTLVALFFCAPIRYYAESGVINGKFTADPNILLSLFRTITDRSATFGIDIADTSQSAVTLISAILNIAVILLSLFIMVRAVLVSNAYNAKPCLIVLIIAAANFLIIAIYCPVYNAYADKRVFSIGINYLFVLAMLGIQYYINILLINLGDRPKPVRLAGGIMPMAMAVLIIYSAAFNIAFNLKLRAVLYPQDYNDANYDITIYAPDGVMSSADIYLKFKVHSNKELKEISLNTVETTEGLLSEGFILTFENDKINGGVTGITIKAINKKTELEKIFSIRAVRLTVNGKGFYFTGPFYGDIQMVNYVKDKPDYDKYP